MRQIWLSTIVMTMLSLGCRRPYVPAGMQRLDYSGTYPVSTSLFNKSCSGVSAHNSTVVVDHAPGGKTMRLTYEGLSFDGTVQPDGKFSVPLSAFRDAVPAGATISGRFTATSLKARVDVRRKNGCQYYLMWNGTKE